MGEISMSGSTRERGAAVIGLMIFHPALSSLLYCYWAGGRTHLGMGCLTREAKSARIGAGVGRELASGKGSGTKFSAKLVRFGTEASV